MDLDAADLERLRAPQSGDRTGETGHVSTAIVPAPVAPIALESPLIELIGALIAETRQTCPQSHSLIIVADA